MTFETILNMIPLVNSKYLTHKKVNKSNNIKKCFTSYYFLF